MGTAGHGHLFLNIDFYDFGGNCVACSLLGNIQKNDNEKGQESYF